jgi:hypothetical protein
MSNSWLNPNRKRFLMAAGLLSGLAVAYYYAQDKGDLMDVEKMNELDRRLYNELKEEVPDIDGIQSVDINAMLDILNVVRRHEKYVFAAKLQELIGDRRNACAAKNFGVWAEIQD